MKDTPDSLLLRDYAERRSEAAFAELVRRHIDLVHSAAFRMTSDAYSAQDVTQAVFLALAQNAGRLAHHPVLSGWLHTTARNLAAKYVRATIRRQHHEQEAVAMNELLSAAPDASWEEIAAHLDAALGELSGPDRDAVLLRYFEKKSAAEIARLLGIGDDAAQKRVSRAVERLREFFARRGVAVGAGGLIVLISTNAVQAAPAALAVTISAAVLAAPAVSTTTVAATTAKAIAMTTLQKTLVTATIAILAGAGIYEARQVSQLRGQNQALAQQQAPLAGQIETLQREREDLNGRLALLAADNTRLKSNSAELLRLRSEVGALQQRAGSSTETVSDPFVQTALTWKSREERLRQLLRDRPEQRIPELSLLDDHIYLEVAREANLDTEDGIRRALSRLRSIAENDVASRLQPALGRFTDAHGGNAPQDVADLAEYLDPSVDRTILERYEILNTGTNIAGGWRGGWVISQKKAVDPDYDRRWLISPVGFGPAAFTAPDK